MKKKLSILMFATILLTGCTTGRLESNSNSLPPNSEVSTSVEQNNELPSVAKDFIEKVNNIRFDENIEYDIEEAYYFYDLIDDYTWNYFPEVQEAFYKLVILEETYYDYLRANNMAEDFIAKVDAIPYFLSIEDERYIIAAENAYEKLENKDIIGVNEAYEKLLKLREQFDQMFL